MPVVALAEALLAFNSKYLVIGVNALPPGTLPVSELSYLIDLDRKLPKYCEIWIGGPVINLNGEKLQHKVQYIRTLNSFDEILKDMQPSPNTGSR